MNLAFKEWAFIVDALGKGKQSIIIRKGGISEEGGDFEIKGKKFFLLPTQFHQAKAMIKESWLPELESERYLINPDTVLIEYFAEVVDSRIISDWDILEKLNNQHAWKPEIIMERFNRWHKNAHLLIVQVYMLKKPFELVMTPELGGCKSWVELNDAEAMEGTLVENSLFKGKF
jgi:hypothetical protein